MRPAPASRSDQPVNDTINLISGEFWGRDPHAELRWIRDNAPVYWDPRGEVWGISTYATVKYVSRHPGLFCNGQGIRPDNGPLPMMIDMDDPEHKLRRKLVSAGFTPRRVADRRAYLERLCDEIIDRVCERGECDFVADLAAQLPLIVIGDALGFAARDRQTLLAWSDDMLRALTGGDDPALLSRAAEAFAGFNDHASAVVADRRACPRDDLISALTHATVDGQRLDHESLLQESLLILIGGDETTRHVISGGMWQLFRHPEQRRALAEDPSGIPAAVEEMLRWVSPIKNMARTATRDTMLDGRAIAEGDTLLLLYPSANRDRAVFTDPDAFDITRHPNEHLAFGNGPHFCLGNSLARLEMQVMFGRLLARLPDLEPVDSAEPAHRPANFVSGYESMPVRFTPTRRVLS
ncbi:cytochrome P450, family 142, subfamily A, polypeptide 1 [Actinomadura madurae]|uniref:Cytochrome P450, family 142, subfamily A, polypeptide 1 n=1 Tax=Actinomadura madurae TaxID=1993 RepID=A0A1I5RHW3_9ACTN|nr:cytochrome P450 [Actinomadura madurae]SFP58092.1 cytochrome P450, family 142, subfamily A, polypeptide 1 [Actinomadura madurae]